MLAAMPFQRVLASQRTFITAVSAAASPAGARASRRAFALAATQPRRADVASATATSNPPPSSQLSATPASSVSATTSNAPPKAASSSTSSGSSAGSQPPKKPKNRIRTFARTVLVTILAGGGYVIWRSYEQRHPGEQLPHDPKLPTVVVLGNGWASTAFLKELDNSGYNVVVISPRNYFLFTPLLPSVTVGTLSARSILEPTRFLTRHLKRKTEVYEGEVYEVDPEKKTVRFVDNSEIKGEVDGTEISYDYLVYAVGAENQTFGIKGVKENACFLKEVWDAEKIRTRIVDCIEAANFSGQTQEEIDRLLSFVVVGGGPTGVEYAGELHDFLMEDLGNWYPDLADRIKITLIEALPNVLPMFSKQLIDYTMSTFQENKINVQTKTMVKEVQEKKLIAQNEKKELVEYPYGLLVWATGNTARQVTKDLMNRLSSTQNSRRGLLVDEHLRLLGSDGIFALGDCTATNYAPTAQVASQQGRYLARVFSKLHKKELLLKELEQAKQVGAEPAKLDSLANAVIRASNIAPFHYSHQGSLAYIGSDKAIADLPVFQGNLAAAGLATYYFWRSAYISQLFSLRNRLLVGTDWLKTKVLGRDVSRA
ncbi:External NADH-ubiquinone oxidoreductase 1, mitochondrial [Rhodotorula toruloides]|uniref:NADH:ubiquinone reductase (non-electrogenic) n=1 Tax=Rhodotorula toruloides TaxID=5286 RepID=A0A0K3C847_RHOTO|nr:External NADH-ubiquinone oxidoreductase 1, mitochondrial [Rhodotorula toruloides]PRQ77904.1 putative NDE1-mitochondrial cytosolically directed NADH dehydrogenase [Rhodotorula toruloides]